MPGMHLLLNKYLLKESKGWMDGIKGKLVGEWLNDGMLDGFITNEWPDGSRMDGGKD